MVSCLTDEIDTITFARVRQIIRNHGRANSTNIDEDGVTGNGYVPAVTSEK